MQGKPNIKYYNNIPTEFIPFTLKAIFENPFIAVYMIDANYVILAFNHAAYNRINAIYNKKLKVGDSWLTYFPENEQNFFIKHFKDVFDGSPVVSERKIQLDNGNEYWFETYHNPVLNNDNQVVANCMNEFDMTQHKQNELEMKKLKDYAESANRAKTEFMAHMSHEFRTPLNAILGYAQILDRDFNMTDDQRRSTDIIYRSSEHLLNLINELLDISKIEARKLELLPSAFYLSECLQSIVEVGWLQANKKGITFLSDFDPNLPTRVYGDSKRLRQVLLNLINNAIKFTHKGSVLFKVHVNNQKIRFCIKDSGVGIYENDLNRIFDEFVQVGDIKYHDKGTGLGLTISKKLVNLMNSELFVESVKDVGSTFWFDIELPAMALCDQNKFKRVQRTGYIGKRKKIFIVDCNEENLSLINDMLLILGFEIVQARDGREALTNITEIKPDLIVIDLMLPVMNGFEVTALIREVPSLKNIPVLAISASVSEKTKQDSLNAGCNDFISKPFHEDELLDKLGLYLDLEWIYKDRPYNQDITLQNMAIIPPPDDILQDLSRFAEIGDIMRIKQQLDKIKEMEQCYIPFAQKLNDLCSDLRINDIKQFVKQFEKHD